jgi:hypothetical protein
MARNTTCTPLAGAWDGVGGVNIGLGVVGAVMAIAAGVTAALAAFGIASLTPASMAIAAWLLATACLFAINLLNKVRDYFFDHRLVCLDGDRCAIARVEAIEDDADGDKALNTILAPAQRSTTESDYQTMFQAKTLVYVDPGLASRGWHLEPKDNRKGSNPATFGEGKLPFFHCEIEGTYLDDWTSALLAYFWLLEAIAIAAFALAIAALALGPIAWAIWIAIAILVFLLALLGLHFAGGSPDTGSTPAGPVGSSTPSPSGPVITDSGGNTISVGDFIALRGRHVCDTGHHDAGGCWDELHPVLAVTKIPQSDYDLAPVDHVAGDIYDKYCDALQGFLGEKGQIEQGLTYLEHPRVG